MPPDGSDERTLRRVKNLLWDNQHPKKSPLLGILLSRTVCALGHEVAAMHHEPWDEPWLACPVCGARFVPVSSMADDYDVVRI